jgi:hypothetical protein
MKLIPGLLLGGAIGLLCACSGPAPEPAPVAAEAPKPAAPATYSMEDFKSVRKLDAHVHMNVVDPAFLEQARDDGFELMTINVDYPDFPMLADQRAAALSQLHADPARVHWATTFSMQGFGKPGWADKVDAALAADAEQGAKAVKVWKNVGMKERFGGKLVMLDDPRFAPLADKVQSLGLTLIGHLGEPQNCWLPLDQMTTDNDREYFKEHPQYHMYLHPEMPSYEDQIKARDNFVAAHPGLRFVGAHLAAWNTTWTGLQRSWIAFSNANVDMAARMSQVQYQSVRDREKVRNFFIKYQDRLLYGTDLTLNPDALHLMQGQPNSSVKRTMSGRGIGVTWRRVSRSVSRSSRRTCQGSRCRAR